MKGYDYRRNELYYITVCANRHANMFGAIEDGVMTPNAIGAIIAEEWWRTAELRPYIGLDAFVLMPNHLHGIIALFDADNRVNQKVASTEVAQSKSNYLTSGSLGAIVGRFKGSVTRRVHEFPEYRNLRVWQRNYYDHIIRNEKSLQDIREYILMNPSRWTEDAYYIRGGRFSETPLQRPSD